MTCIANPIYDAVFKYMMEDEKVAKVLLRALLKKEIVQLEFRKQEYTAMRQNRISLFRMDFNAKIRDEDGTEHLVLIELQKTWLATETLRFRQYLGTQYLEKDNMAKDTDTPYGLPIISIYILGHLLSDLQEPVIYVRRRYLDYYDNMINQTDKFIESLTHDSIIVQIPCLKKQARNHLERLLLLFDQDLQMNDPHMLEIDEEGYTSEEQLVIYRLLKAGALKEIRRQMDVEDEILSEIEARDTLIMQKNKEIEQKEQVIEQKKLVIEEKEQMIEQKEQVIEQKEQVIEQKEQMIEQKEQVIEQKEQMIEQNKQVIEQKDHIIEQKDQVLKAAIDLLHKSGLAPESIATQLSLPLEKVLGFIG